MGLGEKTGRACEASTQTPRKGHGRDEDEQRRRNDRAVCRVPITRQVVERAQTQALPSGRHRLVRGRAEPRSPSEEPLPGGGRAGGKEGFSGNDGAIQEEGPKGEKHVGRAESSICPAALGV